MPLSVNAFKQMTNPYILSVTDKELSYLTDLADSFTVTCILFTKSVKYLCVLGSIR